VPGSPMLCAQSAPTAEPGSICALEGKGMDEDTVWQRKAQPKCWRQVSGFCLNRKYTDAIGVRKELTMGQVQTGENDSHRGIDNAVEVCVVSMWWMSIHCLEKL
jgi:hypothetical protein